MAVFFAIGFIDSTQNPFLKDFVAKTNNAECNNGGTTVTLTVPNVPYTAGGPNPVVIVNPEIDLPGALIIAWSRVTATNTVKIAFRNVSNSSISSQTISFDISVIQ